MSERSLSDVTHEAIAILCREIGVVDTLRFINQFTSGMGNYTEERAQLFDHLTVDEILEGIKRLRKVQ